MRARGGDEAVRVLLYGWRKLCSVLGFALILAFPAEAAVSDGG